VVLVSAPGRVNLLGEHTDYNGGPVLPLALERRLVVAAGYADRWEAASALDPGTVTLDPEDRREGHWSAYVTATLRVLRRAGVPLRGARLAIASGVPPGAGLGSSAALCVALARALTGLAGRRTGPEELAELAWLAEHDEVGVRCGRMDQTVSALARAGQALLFETGSGAVTHVPFPGKVWIFETGRTHRLTGGEYNLRRQECEEALRLCRDQGLDVTTLAAVPEAELGRLTRSIPVPWSLRLRHVVTETGRTRRAAAALAARDLVQTGALLFEGHASLQRDFQSSCDEADLLVQACREHGALGARLSGAGWGGAVVALLPEESEARIVAEVQESFRQARDRLPTVWASRAAAGVRSEK